MRSTLILIAFMLIMTSFNVAGGVPVDDKPFWTGLKEAEFAHVQNDRLASAQKALDRMLAVKDKRTIENTLVPYNDALIDLDAAGSQAGLMEQVHPDKAFRESAEKLGQKI